MSQRMKNIWAVVTVVTLMVNLLVPAFAQDGPSWATNVGAQGAYGQITALGDNSISILPRHVGETRTFSINPETSILIDNKAATLDKLQVGKMAVVSSGDGFSTSVINEYVPPKASAAGGVLLILGLIGIAVLASQHPKAPSMPSLPVLPRP